MVAENVKDAANCTSIRGLITRRTLAIHAIVAATSTVNHAENAGRYSMVGKVCGVIDAMLLVTAVATPHAADARRRATAVIPGATDARPAVGRRLAGTAVL